MSEHSKIQWCDDTHNFWRGCTKVSTGCANCYAEKLVTTRLQGEWGKGAQRMRSKSFDVPLKWNKTPHVCNACGACHSDESVFVASEVSFGNRMVVCDGCGKYSSVHRRRVFSLSLGDWLDGEVPIEWLADMLDVIRHCPNLDFLLLTKRPENWKQRLHDVAMLLCGRHGQKSAEFHGWLNCWLGNVKGMLPQNIWVGASIEDQKSYEERAVNLMRIPATKRFLSYEPALESVRLSPAGLGPFGITWIIVGGESGPNARPFNIEWAQSTIAQCRGAGVACFVKQLGKRPVFNHIVPGCSVREALEPLTLADSHGGDMAEWPEDLRVREFPT